jgi:hypothetical protein
VTSPQQARIQRGFATAAVLMVLVLVLFAIARLLGGRQAGQVGRRQAKRIRARSARDVVRFDRLVGVEPEQPFADLAEPAGLAASLLPEVPS